MLVRGFHGGCVHVGTEALAQPLDRRIRLECSRGADDLILFLKQALSRGLTCLQETPYRRPIDLKLP